MMALTSVADCWGETSCKVDKKRRVERNDSYKNVDGKVGKKKKKLYGTQSIIALCCFGFVWKKTRSSARKRKNIFESHVFAHTAGATRKKRSEASSTQTQGY